MKVLWAVDAFESNPKLIKKMALFLKALQISTNASVIPLFLYQTFDPLIPELHSQAFEDDHSKTAEKLFKEILFEN